MNNKYLRRKLMEAGVNPAQVIGFYWDGLHEESGLVRCNLDDMPRILSHDYILLRCDYCGKEFYKRVIDLLPTCKSCNSIDHYNSMRTDYIPMITNELKYSKLIGYLSDGADTELIKCGAISELPQLGCSDYIRLQCNECNYIYDRRLNHLAGIHGCPRCSRARSNSQRVSDWRSRLCDFVSEFNLTIIGYYVDDELVDHIDDSTLRKSTVIRVRCNECGEEFDRGLYHLDYGCPFHSVRSRSFKSGIIDGRFGIQSYSSNYEKLFIEIAIDLPEFTELHSQPLSQVIPYTFEGSSHRYYPDFEVVFLDRKFIVEIKPSIMIDDLKIQAKIDAAIKYYYNSEYTYIVITEEELHSSNPLESIIDRFNTEDKLIQSKER